MSTVYGASTAQEASMEPSITQGTRKYLTALDAAALTDIGWSVLQPGVPGDYNHNGKVETADYTVWRDSLGAQGVGLAADGNRNFQIDAADYSVWKSNFGQPLDGSASSLVGATAGLPGSVSPLPEPTTILLLIAGIASLVAHRPWRFSD